MQAVGTKKGEKYKNKSHLGKSAVESRKGLWYDERKNVEILIYRLSSNCRGGFYIRPKSTELRLAATGAYRMRPYIGAW